MSAIVSQITNLTIVFSTVYSGADQRKHQNSASLACVWGIHRWPVNSPQKGPVTRKMFPFDDVIIFLYLLLHMHCRYHPGNMAFHSNTNVSQSTCVSPNSRIQYIPRNMHRVFALLCFVVVIHWLIFPYPSGLLHWHCGNLTIAPVPAKQPWWIWINTSCEFIMNDCITTTKQSTTKPCAYFLGYTVSITPGTNNFVCCANHKPSTGTLT